MAMIAVGSLNPHGAPVLRSEIAANSITLTESDSVKVTSGFVALGTAGALVFGHAVAIASNKGLGLDTTGAAGAEMGSFIGTFATASDNQTVAKVRAVCDISKFSLYSAELSAAVGGTTGSNLLGYKLDLSDEDTLDETTATTSTAQYNNWGLDPADSTKIIVNIYESQVFGV
jgi:hypothetical protein